MIKVFDKLVDYYSYVSGGLNSGDIYFVNEDKSSHFMTNNIDGELKIYDMIQEIGGDSDSDIVATFVNLSVTENGVYKPEEYNADGFASVAVSVPVPEGYVLPSGNLSITSNASSINVAQYETVSVSVSGGSTPSISWVNSTTASTWGEMVTPATAITAEVTVGKTYRIHFDGTYSSETRMLYIWGHGSDYDVEGMYGYIDPSVNNFDFTILPFIYISSEGGSTVLASDFELHIAIVDGAPESEQGATYAFRYAELPQYPAGGPTA